jgi:hypothetical protein
MAHRIQLIAIGLFTFTIALFLALAGLYFSPGLQGNLFISVDQNTCEAYSVQLTQVPWPQVNNALVSTEIGQSPTFRSDREAGLWRGRAQVFIEYVSEVRYRVLGHNLLIFNISPSTTLTPNCQPLNQ